MLCSCHAAHNPAVASRKNSTRSMLAPCAVGRSAVLGEVRCCALQWVSLRLAAGLVLHEPEGGLHCRLIGAGYLLVLGYLRGIPIYIHVLRGYEPARGPHGELGNSAGPELASALRIVWCVSDARGQHLTTVCFARLLVHRQACRQLCAGAWFISAQQQAAHFTCLGRATARSRQPCCYFAAGIVIIAAAAAAGIAACSDPCVCLHYADICSILATRSCSTAISLQAWHNAATHSLCVACCILSLN
jgi:hypothetical protein